MIVFQCAWSMFLSFLNRWKRNPSLGVLQSLKQWKEILSSWTACEQQTIISKGQTCHVPKFMFRFTWFHPFSFHLICLWKFWQGKSFSRSVPKVRTQGSCFESFKHSNFGTNVCTTKWQHRYFISNPLSRSQSLPFVTQSWQRLKLLLVWFPMLWSFPKSSVPQRYGFDLFPIQRHDKWKDFSKRAKHVF